MLALVQGLTEFLPISSDAQRILVPAWTAVAMHVATLVAISRRSNGPCCGQR
nr:undecaprenyl-diphosphate phosphatase [Thioalkalivibrio sp.]